MGYIPPMHYRYLQYIIDEQRSLGAVDEEEDKDDVDNDLDDNIVDDDRDELDASTSSQ